MPLNRSLFSAGTAQFSNAVDIPRYIDMQDGIRYLKQKWSDLSTD